MRKVTVLVMGIFASAAILMSAGAAANHQKGISEDVSEQIILRLLHQPTTSAVDTYYGERRQYWRQDILRVEKIPQSPYFEVVVQVETFCGAHNPPYGIETMTFYVGILGEVQLVSFDHQDDP